MCVRRISQFGKCGRLTTHIAELPFWMDLPSAYDLCLSLPHAEATTPFGPDIVVFKVAGKVFALTSPDEFPPRMNLKCDPDRAVELREEYSGIQPGYHMNKKHWNTLILDGSVPSALVRELIYHSYDLVVAALPAVRRREMGV
jgi:predicted DNA-binding protein (MmcQ/YjbR family)